MILYIEDTKEIAENVVAYLETEWFSVDRYQDWQEGLDAWLSKYYDCVILDIMMPWIDGIEVCKTIRTVKNIPIIMTTAKGMLENKAEAYDYGADDYLVKPFEIAELVMRIHALLKRTGTSDSLTLWEFDIYIDENRITKHWTEISLTLKERQILMELINAQWWTVSRATIIDAVRWWDALFDNNDWKLDVYIANLRKKLTKELIETIKWVWYRVRY